MFILEKTKDAITFRRIGLGFDSTDPAQIWALLEDREGSLWLGTTAGLIRRLPDGSFHHYKVLSHFGDQLVRALLEDHAGRIWLNRQESVIAFMPPPVSNRADVLPGLSSPRKSGGLPIARGDARQFTTADGLSPSKVRTLFESHDGRIWVGSAPGLSELDGERFRSYGTAEGLSDVINAIAEDGNGNLWIGTDLSGALSGALRVAKNGFSTFKEAHGLAHPWIASIFEDRTGKLYAVSGGEAMINASTAGGLPV